MASRDDRGRILLLGRPGCHLCDDARAVIERVAAELGVDWEERDITASPEDMKEYWDKIPVTFVDGVQIDFWRVSEVRLRAALGLAPDHVIFRSDQARCGPGGRPRPGPPVSLCESMHKGVPWKTTSADAGSYRRLTPTSRARPQERCRDAQ
jgi:hypothetical protein